MQEPQKLLGLQLKDDDVIELLEFFEIKVVYDFDRLHENTDDTYWAAATSAGFQLRFNKNQILDTIFLYVQPAEGFSPFDFSVSELQVFDTFAEAGAWAIENDVPFKQSQVTSGARKYNRWIKFDHGSFTVHYEFAENQRCRLITLQHTQTT